MKRCNLALDKFGDPLSHCRNGFVSSPNLFISSDEVHSVKELEGFHPFDKPEYYHQLDLGNLTFDEYVQGYAYGGKGYPPPVQAIGPGAMCKRTLGSCDNYRCPNKTGFGEPCPVTPTFMGDKAAGPEFLPHCGVGDEVCEGYNVTQTIEGPDSMNKPT